ncbi:MAG: toll/interleukin-1 receptor domain-containing protein [Promethearchaeota archaeon]
MSKDITSEGAWIFLSHSHKDLEKVRAVRNELEQKGHNPLMFFLKCLNDNSELDDLIEREIEARTWFLLCESPNARKSRWVQKEIEIIKSLEGKVYKTINLEEDFAKQLKKIRAFERRATIFISYLYDDRDTAKAITDTLIENDFGISFPVSESEDTWPPKLNEVIERTIREGFFLVLLSPNAIRSKNLGEEVKIALQFKQDRAISNIIPIIIDDPEYIYNNLASMKLENVKCIDFTKDSFEKNMAKLIHHLKTVKID